MKTYFLSELYYRGKNPSDCYYIKYSVGSREVEFWTDDEDEYEKKLGFVERHIGDYKLLDKNLPMC